MKILFLTRAAEHPATRYRVAAFVEPLRAAGIEPTLLPYPHGLTGWMRILRGLRGQDALFVQKKRLSAPLLHWLKRRGTPIVYDFDDAVLFRSSRHETPESPSRRARFERMVRGCAGVVAGSGYLRSLVVGLNPRVWVVPTSIDCRRYRVRAHDGGSARVILGWIGGRKSLVFLAPLAPVFARIGREFPHVALQVVCNAFPPAAGLRVIEKPWREAEEAEDVAGFDIGLAPLPDDPWARGKCATKLLQCMAAGVPAVASPVGAHLEIVTDGRDGLLAGTEEEWYDHLARLIRDPALRGRLGAAGRKRVEDAYSVAANAPRLIEALHCAVGSRTGVS